eukprot:gene12364-biopygen911
MLLTEAGRGFSQDPLEHLRGILHGYPRWTDRAERGEETVRRHEVDDAFLRRGESLEGRDPSRHSLGLPDKGILSYMKRGICVPRKGNVCSPSAARQPRRHVGALRLRRGRDEPAAIDRDEGHRLQAGLELERVGVRRAAERVKVKVPAERRRRVGRSCLWAPLRILVLQYRGEDEERKGARGTDSAAITGT